MNPVVELITHTPEECELFEKACADYQEVNGPHSLHQILIHSTIEASYLRRQRDDLRKDYAMLQQAYNQSINRVRRLERLLEQERRQTRKTQ